MDREVLAAEASPSLFLPTRFSPNAKAVKVTRSTRLRCRRQLSQTHPIPPYPILSLSLGGSIAYQSKGDSQERIAVGAPCQT